jgi:hypothetical protein
LQWGVASTSTVQLLDEKRPELITTGFCYLINIISEREEAIV